MADRGEAAGYYEDGQRNNYQQQQQQGYGQQQQQGYGGGYNQQQQQQQQPRPEQMQQQQQYGGPPYMGPPPSYNQNWNQSEGKPSFDQAFKVEKPKFNDLWAAILFLAVCAGFVAVSGLTIHSYATTRKFQGGSIYGGNNTFGLGTNTLVLFVFCAAVALVLGYGYVLIARTFTKQLIWITGILNIIFVFVTAIYMLSRKYYSGGIVFLIFGAFTIFCFYTWIPRIPFSVLLLQTVVDVSKKKYGHVYLVSFIGGLLATAFGVWFSVTLVAIYAKYQPGNNPSCRANGANCSSGTVIGLIVFITFAAYWISEVLKNTVHVIISGVYGAWYFSPNNPPKGATRGAARRALTYSFGSISFGSLIVAIIQFLRHLVSVARANAGGSGNFGVQCAFCVLQCLIGLLEWAVEFVNRYAFSYMALYGDSYLRSAKATWKLIKDRGIDALINECLLGPVFTMGATFVAYVCALLAYLYIVFTKPEYNANGSFTPVIVAYAFLIGLQITNCFTVPLSSGIDTLFVAAAWDPEVLMREHGDLYQRMVQVYPHVQQAIHA